MKWLIAANLVMLVLIGCVAFHVQVETRTIFFPVPPHHPPPPIPVETHE